MIDLPFTPYFFKGIDEWQRLSEFEVDAQSNVRNRVNWEVEKYLLAEVTKGADNYYRGGFLDQTRITNIRAEGVEKGNLDGNSEFKPSIVQNALVSRGYAGWDRRGQHYHCIVINETGYLAGRILRETNMLRNNVVYRYWIKLWKIIFLLATLYLFASTLQAVGEVFVNRLLKFFVTLINSRGA